MRSIGKGDHIEITSDRIFHFEVRLPDGRDDADSETFSSDFFAVRRTPDGSWWSVRDIATWDVSHWHRLTVATMSRYGITGQDTFRDLVTKLAVVETEN